MKKIISVLLVCLMVAAMFVGCAKDLPGSTQTPTNEATTPVDNTESVSNETVPEATEGTTAEDKNENNETVEDATKAEGENTEGDATTDASENESTLQDALNEIADAAASAVTEATEN